MSLKENLYMLSTAIALAMTETGCNNKAEGNQDQPKTKDSCDMTTHHWYLDDPKSDICLAGTSATTIILPQARPIVARTHDKCSAAMSASCAARIADGE